MYYQGNQLKFFMKNYTTETILKVTNLKFKFFCTDFQKEYIETVSEIVSYEDGTFGILCDSLVTLPIEFIIENCEILGGEIIYYTKLTFLSDKDIKIKELQEVLNIVGPSLSDAPEDHRKIYYEALREFNSLMAKN